jgi:hypothetical protein
VATTEGLTKAIGCLSTTFPQFLAKEIARLADSVVSATQAIADPLSAIADTNVQGVIDDVATLSQNRNLDDIGVIGEGLIRSYVTREAREELEAMAAANPKDKKKILDALNTGEKVMSSAMVMFSLYREAPYVVAQKMCENLERLTQLKIDNLNCLKRHILQMNNCVSALAKAKNEIVNFPVALAALSAALEAAKQNLTRAVTTVGGSTVINSQALSAAKAALQQGDVIIDPTGADHSILDVVNILTSGTTSSEHITESNIWLAAMAVPHISFYLEAEMAAIERTTEAINFLLDGLATVMVSFRSSAVSSRTKEIRSRTIQSILSKTTALKAEVDAARQSNVTSIQTHKSLLWSSRLKTLISMLDKVQSNSSSEGSSEGSNHALELSKIYDDLIYTITQINSEHVVVGVEDISTMKTQVTHLRKAGNHILKVLDEKAVTDSDMLTFTTLVATTAIGGNNLIDESVRAAYALQVACQSYLATDIGFRKDYDKLITLFEALGWDRARDMLDAGRFVDFFNSSMDGLSYLNTAINCLTEAINGVDDANTKQEIATLRDDLQSRRSNQLLTAADNLNFGATKILADAKRKLEEFERRKQTALNLVDKLRAIYRSINGNLVELDEVIGTTYTAMKGNHEQLAIDSKGRLSDAWDEFLERPRAGVPMC